MKHVRTNRHPWLIACDANMCPEQGARRRRLNRQIQGSIGELNERTYDYVIASHGLQVKIKNMEVVEDFESRPHKAVTFLVERDTESRCAVTRKCRKRFQDSAVEGCQEEARWQKQKRRRGRRGRPGEEGGE